MLIWKLTKRKISLAESLSADLARAANRGGGAPIQRLQFLRDGAYCSSGRPNRNRQSRVSGTAAQRAHRRSDVSSSKARTCSSVAGTEFRVDQAPHCRFVGLRGGCEDN